MKIKRDVIIIRKSCLTGKVVWLYRGPSKNASYVAYYRACKQELLRVNCWHETAAQRKRNILRLLNECLDAYPFTVELSPKQKALVNQLRALSEEDIASHREFYDHIIEEHKRRVETKELLRKMREREMLTNSGYV